MQETKYTDIKLSVSIQTNFCLDVYKFYFIEIDIVPTIEIIIIKIPGLLGISMFEKYLGSIVL